MTSYSGAGMVFPSPYQVASAGNATASAAMTVPVAAGYGSYAVWVNGRSASSTLSALSVSTPNWTSPSIAAESAGTVSLTLMDGLLSSTGTPNLTASSSASIQQGNVSVVLTDGLFMQQVTVTNSSTTSLTIPITVLSSVNHLSGIERGVSNSSWSTIYDVCAALKVTASKLLGF